MSPSAIIIQSRASDNAMFVFESISYRYDCQRILLYCLRGTFPPWSLLNAHARGLAAFESQSAGRRVLCAGPCRVSRMWSRGHGRWYVAGVLVTCVCMWRACVSPSPYLPTLMFNRFPLTPVTIAWQLASPATGRPGRQVTLDRGGDWRPDRLMVFAW